MRGVMVERGPTGEVVVWLDALGVTVVVVLLVLLAATCALWGYAIGRRR